MWYSLLALALLSFLRFSSLSPPWPSSSCSSSSARILPFSRSAWWWRCLVGSVNVHQPPACPPCAELGRRVSLWWNAGLGGSRGVCRSGDEWVGSVSPEEAEVRRMVGFRGEVDGPATEGVVGVVGTEEKEAVCFNIEAIDRLRCVGFGLGGLLFGCWWSSSSGNSSGGRFRAQAVTTNITIQLDERVISTKSTG